MTIQEKTNNSKKQITLLAYMGNFIENIKYMREYVYIQFDYRIIIPSVVKESILWLGFKRPSTYWG